MKSKLPLFILAVIILFAIGASGQDKLNRNDTIEVWHGTNQLKLPWASGLNAAHVSEIDMNYDGLMDLIIFEANNLYDPLTGDKLLPLLRETVTGGGFRYVYAPELFNNFPKLSYFAQFQDFNKDGKMDLFTRNEWDRIVVYKNTGDATKGLQFEVFIESLESNPPAGGLPPNFPFFPDIFQDFINLSSFEDIDGDGDIDALILSRNESYIEYYKNVSPSTDTIILEYANACWGNAAITKDSIVLNTCTTDGNIYNPESTGKPGGNQVWPSHTNSGNGNKGDKGNKDAGVSLLAIDLNGDGVKDMITGSPTRLRQIINGGGSTPANPSNFVSYNNSFPAAHPAKDFNSYVYPFYVDVDFDNVKDLIATVAWNIFESDSSISFYKNTGTNSHPNFVFQTDAFLQEDMIDVGSGAYPVLFDYNSDGLMDIVIGNEGYFINYSFPRNNIRSSLALYENTGTKYAPEFKLVTEDYLGLASMKLDLVKNEPGDALYPTFGDVDGDGDEDMIIGDLNGKLHYFENTAGAGNPAAFAPPVIDFLGIDVGDSATPFLFDLNRDEVLDLIVGESLGNLNYFEGSKNNPGEFALVTENLGQVQVKEYWDFWGNSVPFIYEDYATQKYFLLCGSKSGFIYFYDSLEVNGVITDTFRLRDSSFQNIWHGPYASVGGGDINADSSLDLLTGNYSGGVVLYTGDPNVIYIPGITEGEGNINVLIYPNPANDFVEINIDNQGANRMYTLHLQNVVGTQVMEKVIRPRDRLDLSSIPPGVYILQITNKKDGISLTRKLVRQ